jgi:hypothetical protein
LIRGRIQWRGEAPPGTTNETVQQVRNRVVDVLNALLIALMRQARKRFPKRLATDRRTDLELAIAELPNYINASAWGELNDIFTGLQQADELAATGHFGAALLRYLNVFELVLAEKCSYETHPEGAFE